MVDLKEKSEQPRPSEHPLKTFAPILSASSVKIVVAVANEKDCLLRHLCSKTGVYPGELERSCIHEVSRQMRGHGR